MQGAWECAAMPIHSCFLFDRFCLELLPSHEEQSSEFLPFISQVSARAVNLCVVRVWWSLTPYL